MLTYKNAVPKDSIFFLIQATIFAKLKASQLSIGNLMTHFQSDKLIKKSLQIT